MEIKILENILDYAPIQNKIKEPKLQQDFEEFCRKMRLKWYFCNAPIPVISTTPAWKPPNGNSSLKFFNQVEKDLFKISKKVIPRGMVVIPSLSRRNLVIKNLKGLYVVDWDCNHYIAEAEKTTE